MSQDQELAMKLGLPLDTDWHELHRIREAEYMDYQILLLGKK